MEQRHDLVVRLQKQLLPPARAHACANRRELKGPRSCVRCVGHFPAPVATAPRGGVKAHPTPMENASLLLAVLVAGVARASRCACSAHRVLWPRHSPPVWGRENPAGHQMHRGEEARPGSRGLPSPVQASRPHPFHARACHVVPSWTPCRLTGTSPAGERGPDSR